MKKQKVVSFDKNNNELSPSKELDQLLKNLEEFISFNTGKSKDEIFLLS